MKTKLLPANCLAAILLLLSLMGYLPQSCVADEDSGFWSVYDHVIPDITVTGDVDQALSSHNWNQRTSPTQIKPGKTVLVRVGPWQFSAAHPPIITFDKNALDRLAGYPTYTSITVETGRYLTRHETETTDYLDLVLRVKPTSTPQQTLIRVSTTSDPKMSFVFPLDIKP